VAALRRLNRVRGRLRRKWRRFNDLICFRVTRPAAEPLGSLPPALHQRQWFVTLSPRGLGGFDAAEALVPVADLVEDFGNPCRPTAALEQPGDGAERHRLFAFGDVEAGAIEDNGGIGDFGIGSGIMLSSTTSRGIWGEWARMAASASGPLGIVRQG